MQEVDDKFCRRAWLFFRDPVPAIRDDGVFDVVGDAPHHRADHRAECRFASQGQDRHLKLPLRKERLVVDRILAERASVPPIFGEANFLDRTFACERREKGGGRA